MKMLNTKYSQKKAIFQVLDKISSMINDLHNLSGVFEYMIAYKN